MDESIDQSSTLHCSNFSPFMQQAICNVSKGKFSDFTNMNRAVDVAQTISNCNDGVPAMTQSNLCSSTFPIADFVKDDLDMSLLLEQFDHAFSLLTGNNTNMSGRGAVIIPDPGVIAAFQIVSQLAPNLIKDVSFRKMFLRADSYNPLAAAKRFILFFQRKMELFGVQKLGKTITIYDLSDEDRNYLYDGRWQVAKERDAAGRVIFCTVAKQNEMSISETSMVR
jgi:hypothetical protein